MIIVLTWPYVGFEGRLVEPAEQIREYLRDVLPEYVRASEFAYYRTRGEGRNELTFEVAHLHELMNLFGAIRRGFASFGITPEIEVDGKPLLEFAWRKDVEAIHRLGLINEAMKELRRPAMNDGNAAIRVALREGINKPFAEIERELLTD